MSIRGIFFKRLLGWNFRKLFGPLPYPWWYQILFLIKNIYWLPVSLIKHAAQSERRANFFSRSSPNFSSSNQEFCLDSLRKFSDELFIESFGKIFRVFHLENFCSETLFAQNSFADAIDGHGNWGDIFALIWVRTSYPFQLLPVKNRKTTSSHRVKDSRSIRSKQDVVITEIIWEGKRKRNCQNRRRVKNIKFTLNKIKIFTWSKKNLHTLGRSR